MYDLFVDSDQVQFSCLLCFSCACGVLWTWSCSGVSSSEAVSESSNEQNLFCLWVSLILLGQCRPCLSERQRSPEFSTSEPFSDSRSHSAGVCHLLSVRGVNIAHRSKRAAGSIVVTAALGSWQLC